MKFLREYASTRRLTLMLFGAFGLTVLSFVASTVIATTAARGISDAAESIVTDAAPSIQHASNARSEARRLALALDDLIDAAGAHAPTARFEAVERDARASFEREWGTYEGLPAYPEEASLRVPVESTRARAMALADEIVGALGRGDAAAALATLTERAEPTLNQLDGALHDVIDFNARQAERLGAEISATRVAARRLVALLDAACACFAVAAAVLIAAVFRHQARLVEIRVSDLEHFAGRVAHDVRSPLTSVGLAMEQAKRDGGIQEKSRAALERGTRAVQNIGQLVDGLLLFAHAGAAPEEGARADVHEVLRGVIEHLRSEVEAKGIELTVDDRGASTAACRPGVLASICSNLLGNAVKYMGDARVRRISVRARDMGPLLRIEVEDTGPGVPPALRERVFDPYVRAAACNVPGLGLGLATVRRLAEAHGGAAGLGEAKTGSLFWVELAISRSEMLRGGTPSPTRPALRSPA
jgi:signal transduction histidine kinase